MCIKFDVVVIVLDAFSTDTSFCKKETTINPVRFVFVIVTCIAIHIAFDIALVTTFDIRINTNVIAVSISTISAIDIFTDVAINIVMDITETTVCAKAFDVNFTYITQWRTISQT